MSCCFVSTNRQKFEDVVVTRMSSRMNPLDLIYYNQVAPARVNTIFGNFPVGCILRHELLRWRSQEDALVFNCDRQLDQVRARVVPCQDLTSAEIPP